MKVLADYHHADLFESHQIVFGDRFGWDVYAPYGMAWFDDWYWSFEREWHGDAVAKQYLLGIWMGAEPDANGVVTIPDTRHPGRMLRGITLEAARSQAWNIVLSTVPSNAPGFARFAREQGGHWGIHVGNQWGDEAWSQTPEFAILTTTSPVPKGIRHVVVHQEFSLDAFRYEPPPTRAYLTKPSTREVYFGPMRSFVNCFPETPEYPQFQSIARKAPEFTWEVYGALGTGKADEFTKHDLHGVYLIGETMRGAGAIWHAKHWSDGFGHVIHNAFAVGRPVFGYQRYYADKLAGPLWQQGVTSFDVEGYSHESIFAEIRRLRDDPDAYLTMCEAAARRFREVVDFDADAEAVRGLLEGVLA